MMRILNTFTGKMVVLAVFAALALSYLAYLFAQAGLRPPWESAPYKISFNGTDVENAIPVGDVKMSGVDIGTVSSVTPGAGKAHVVLNLDQQAAPLHQGVTARIGAKSIAGETYIDIKDGKGPPLPSGATLPDSAVLPGTQLADVVKTFDPQMQESLRSLVRTAGSGTAGTQQDISSTMAGLGKMGREGYTAVDAISAQSKDLTALARQTTDVLSALDSGQGQIATLVDKSNELTSATSGQQENVASTVRKLPGVLSSTQRATGKLGELSSALGPVASDLRSASPDLDNALHQLPATTRDLRGLLPDLNATLQQSPNTLNRVPTVAQDVSTLVPQARTMMTQLNPMLGYIAPYGKDFGSFFSNFAAIFNYTDEAGAHFFRLQPDLGNEQIVKGVPVKLPGILTNDNPYPAPGQNTNSKGLPFTKLYPRPN